MAENMTPAVKWQGSTVCDFCHKDARKVGPRFYDGKTARGPWALMCEGDFLDYGIKLGQGWGQAYDSKTLEKVEG